MLERVVNKSEEVILMILSCEDTSEKVRMFRAHT